MAKPIKFYIIAGEASGDLHASNLMKALTKQAESQGREIEFRCWGGDLMQAQGGHLVKHFKDLAFMGFAEVVANLGTILKNIKFCKADIKYYNPDVVVMIDYPGFNLRIADFVKSIGIKVFYYISPQIWAWKENRVHKIKRLVDKMFVILPFEKDFYKKYDYDVEYCGHPLLDVINKESTTDSGRSAFLKVNDLSEKPIIVLLPGSREQEVKRMLEVLISVTNQFTKYQFVIAGAPSLPMAFYESVVTSEIPILFGKTYDLYRYAEAGLVTSGTATLEAALFRLPQVVLYKTSPISYQIGKRLVKVKYMSLVNLILDEEAVVELLQDEVQTPRVIKELTSIIVGGENREKILEKYEILNKKLGGGGASRKIATSMLKSV